jgi:hypothetical protein
MVLITRVNRVPNSGFNNGDLTSWTPLGGATVTAVNNLSWRARVTFPASAPAGTAGIQVPLKDLTPGVASRVWASVPTASGSTTVKIQISDSGGMGGGNLLPNPGFEVDASGWTGATRTTTTPHTGVACGAISTSMSTPSGTSGIPVSASTSYYVEGWAFSVNANATATVTVAWFNAGGSLISTTSMTPVALSGRPWTQVAPGIITSPGTAAFAQVIGTKTGGFGSLLFDDMWFGPAGAPAAVGAAFATNEPLFKVGALNHTPVSSTATLQIVNAVTAGAADWVEIDYALYDDGTTTSYPFFDGSYPGAHWEGSPVSTAAVFEGYDTEVSDRPVAVVEIDARPITSMDFVLDRDALDNPNVAPVDSPRWVTVPETKSVSINRGRDNEEQEIGPGTATIVLEDYDGVYDPDNYHSPLQTGKGYQAIHSGMGVRVSALAQSLGTLVPIPMFTGSLDDTSIDRTWEPLMTLSAVDDISKINNADIPPFDPAIGDGSTTLYRALWALGYAGLELWDASFGTALTRQMLATSGGGNVGSHLRDVAACEGGKVYVKADGTLHIGTHADDFAYTPAATFTDDQQANGEVEYDDIQTSTSIGRIINRCIITRGDPAESTTGEGSSGPATGAEAVTAQDDESIAFCGRVFSETVEVPLYNRSDAEAMAVWRATRRSRTATRVDSVKFSMHSQPLAWQVLALDLSNVVRVRRQAWNRTLDGTYAVEGIAWEIIAGGSWTGEVNTSPLQINSLYSDGAHPFFIGTSLLDGPDIIAAY